MNMHNTTNYGLCVVSSDEVSLSVVKMCFEKVFFSFCFVQKSTKTLWYNFLMNQIRTFVVSLNWVRILWKPFDLCVCVFCLVFVLFLKYDFFFRCAFTFIEMIDVDQLKIGTENIYNKFSFCSINIFNLSPRTTDIQVKLAQIIPPQTC